MSVVQTVQDKIFSMPAGQVFGYQDLPDYIRSPSAVVKALSRMVSERQVARLSKGKFYVPKQGLLGPRKPSDDELIRSVLYKDGRLRGYVTGLALYNRLGLTTQVPSMIMVALNGGAQEKDFGTIRVKTVIARYPVREQDIPLLQYLDALKDIKKIPDADTTQSLKIMQRYILSLDKEARDKLTDLALEYYGAQVRALLGLLMNGQDSAASERLKRSLNPTTVIKLDIDTNVWAQASEWNIRP